jgi:anti-sigma B factor antagonist
MDLAYSHTIRDNILIITLQGIRLDAVNASLFKNNALKLIQRTGLSKVVMDLSHVQFIDSSGLGALLAIQRSLNKQGGALKLAHLNKNIQTMFEIVSMHRILDIFPTIEDTIKSF